MVDVADGTCSCTTGRPAGFEGRGTADSVLDDENEDEDEEEPSAAAAACARSISTSLAASAALVSDREHAGISGLHFDRGHCSDGWLQPHHSGGG